LRIPRASKVVKKKEKKGGNGSIYRRVQRKGRGKEGSLHEKTKKKEKGHISSFGAEEGGKKRHVVFWLRSATLSAEKKKKRKTVVPCLKVERDTPSTCNSGLRVTLIPKKKGGGYTISLL